MLLPRLPPCGSNERLNAAVHGALAVCYLACLAYHMGATVEHLHRWLNQHLKEVL